MIIKIYRCRLCGKLINDNICSNDISAEIEYANIDTDVLKRHYCSDGSLGIAEMIGYKRQKESQ